MSSKTERSIFMKYRKILLAVVLFMAADSVVVGTSIYGTYLSNESELAIDLSVRQQMLSQRVAKALLLLQHTADTEDAVHKDSQLKELELSAGLFDATLKGFASGGTVKGGNGMDVRLQAVETDIGQAAIAEASRLWDPYLQLLAPLRHGNGNFTRSQLEAAVAYSERNDAQLLKAMGDLANDLEHTAGQHMDWLRLVLFAGIAVAILNFGYTMFISLSDLAAKDEEVEKARRETVDILETVHEGLFLLDRKKNFGSQFSAVLPGLLQTPITPGMPFLPVLQLLASTDLYEAASDYIDLLLGERVKESLVQSLNPLVNMPATLLDAQGREQERYLSFFFNRVRGEGQKVRHLLVTVQDVTDRVLLMRQLEEAKNKARTDMENILELLSGDLDGLLGFVRRTGEALTQANSVLSQAEAAPQGRLRALDQVLRAVHTIKGEAGLLGLELFETYAHACEQEMVAMRGKKDKGGSVDNMLLRVTVLLEGFYERYTMLADIVGRFNQHKKGNGKRPAAAGGAEATETKSMQEIEAPGQPLAEHLEYLARRIAADEKKQVRIACDLGALGGLSAERASALQGACIQLVRNAVAHGIEMPAERRVKGKLPMGELQIRCETKDGQVNFMVRDDGVGIVPDRLREQFIKGGVLSAKEAYTRSDREIAQLIFKPGVSTREGADRDAGHGIGLDAVLEQVHRMGGQLNVKSQPNEYTEFHIRFAKEQ